MSSETSRVEFRDDDNGSTSARPTVAVIGGKPKFVRKAHELGLNVVYIQNPNEYERAHWPYVDQALLLDYSDLDQLLPLVQALHAVRPLAGIVSLYELGLVPAAKLSAALGLQGGTPLATVQLLLDKWQMRQLLNERGISPVAATIGETEQDLHDFVQEHGLPVVVKPISEAGSIGVFAVHEEADIASVTSRFRALRNEFDRKDLAGELDQFLMEEFLDGPEISVETLSFDGRHILIGVTDKMTGGPGFVEVGHSTPSRRPAAVLQEVEQLVLQFLDVVGLRQGPAHTEVKLTSRGPRIIESHNRIGGDRINELTEVAYGVDMDRYAIGAPFGLIAPLEESPKPIAGAAIRFFTPPPGRVVAVNGTETVGNDPALVELELKLKPGDTVPRLTWSDDRVGHVIARGETTDDAIANCERLLETVHIDIDIEPVPGPAA